MLFLRPVKGLHTLVKVGKNISGFSAFFFSYTKKRLFQTLFFFEGNKNTLVKFFMMKRGRYSRPFLHFATMSVLGIGVMITPLLADTYPLFAANGQGLDQTPTATSQQSIAVDNNVFQTSVSSKLRSKIITYTVERGDTLSSIAQKFGVSVDTLKWQNDLTSDSVTAGDSLDILPVTGVAYKVRSGDTVYSIAKKFATNPQKIVDFPFNDFADPETFTLVSGEIIIVPDGVNPANQSQSIYQTQYAEVPTSSTSTQTPSAGGFIWPITGIITQYFTIYHNALDIAGPVGTPIYAARAGTIMEASCGWNYGYGCHVLMDNGGGYSTMYAHMVSQPAVSVGQSVNQGQLIGYRGDTGNSTGPHTHFEIRIGGHAVNPLPFLQ
ncbi:MAG TPA: peptidoglycan DD-metalloendopeptidase family protein [Candidatus Saccharimonadales bacterium]|nr:peptidoglycan DD-metalloendopeptidase family protein [Candidatus Saccharimonadales bacterium]